MLMPEGVNSKRKKSEMELKRNDQSYSIKTEEIMNKWQQCIEYFYEYDTRQNDIEMKQEYLGKKISIASWKEK